MPILPHRGKLRDYSDPDVVEERNKRLAVWVWKNLGCADHEAIRHICNELNAVTQGTAPQKLVEYLHEKLLDARPAVHRTDISKAIAACHEEAFGWLQHTHHDVRD